MNMISPFDVGFYVFEDFLTNTSISDADVGKNLWDIDAISGGADTLTYETYGGETFLRMTGGGAGDGDGTALGLKADAVTIGPNGGFVRAKVRIPNITGNAVAANNFRIGFSDVRDSSEPVVGLYFESDGGVLSISAMSANGDLTQAVDGTSASLVPTSVLTSNTTMILGTTYDFELRWSGSNSNADPGPQTVDFFVNGHWAAHIDNVLLDGAETMEATITHWCDTGGASTLELDVFGYEAKSDLTK
jgi:hypothetical protein